MPGIKISNPREGFNDLNPSKTQANQGEENSTLPSCEDRNAYPSGTK